MNFERKNALMAKTIAKLYVAFTMLVRQQKLHPYLG